MAVLFGVVCRLSIRVETRSMIQRWSWRELQSSHGVSRYMFETQLHEVYEDHGLVHEHITMRHVLGRSNELGTIHRDEVIFEQ